MASCIRSALRSTSFRTAASRIASAPKTAAAPKAAPSPSRFASQKPLSQRIFRLVGFPKIPKNSVPEVDDDGVCMGDLITATNIQILPHDDGKETATKDPKEGEKFAEINGEAEKVQYHRLNPSRIRQSHKVQIEKRPGTQRWFQGFSPPHVLLDLFKRVV